nr:MAG TPA: hypothetical protein [Bacteriophage sp.]
MTSREQFEKWFSDNFGRPYYSDEERDELEVYTFLAWRASREEIEIKACPCPNDHGPYVDDHYREQINNAGLKLEK